MAVTLNLGNGYYFSIVIVKAFKNSLHSKRPWNATILTKEMKNHRTDSTILGTEIKMVLFWVRRILFNKFLCFYNL